MAGATVSRKVKKGLEWISISFLVLIFLVAVSLFSYQVAHANKIYKNVYVADIDLSGKTKTQAKYLLQKLYSNMMNEELTLRAENDEVKVKMSDTGIVLDIDKVINECYAIGRDDDFITQLRKTTQTFLGKQNVELTAKIDEKKYNKFLEIAVSQFNIDPQDASLKIESGEIKTVEEKNGRKVDTDDLIDKLLRVTKQDEENIVEVTTVPALPSIKTADFDKAIKQAKSILSKQYSFTYENKNYQPSKTDVGNWIVFSNKDKVFSVSISDSGIQAYLNRIAKNFEIQKKDKKINATDNKVIEEGREGKYLDKNDAISQIKNQIFSKSVVAVAMKTYTEAPQEVKVFPAEGIVPGKFEGKYVDIDLTNQKLCKVEGNKVLGCYTVSSGKPSMPTPTGTRYIQSKSPRQWSATYGLWMPWWQHMGNSYGIHELPEWPNGYKEGEDHLGTPVSHGCVRLGIGPAEDVYNFTEIGTPVYIHK